MYRRDMILGIALVVIVLGALFMAFVALSALSMDTTHVSKESVALIEITGPIFDPMPVVEKLQRYTKDDKILAIVLRLNTPGGGISATQEIYETVKKARKTGKIIVASVGSVAASGGYYIAVSCDSVVATAGSITGSIGVIANFAEFSTLFEKIGITFNVSKSGKFKDTGSASRKMTEEEKALIDEVIMDSFDQFVEAVSEGRHLENTYVRKYADGRIFTGRQAKQYGFIDELGTYQDAIDMAGTMVGLGEDPPVYKETKGLFWEVMVDGMSYIMSELLELQTPRISYIWTH